jgi:thiaminase
LRSITKTKCLPAISVINEVARQFREEQGDIYQNWYRGYLTAQAEIRKTVLDAALNSSQPAILQMLKYFRQSEEENLEAFEMP